MVTVSMPLSLYFSVIKSGDFFDANLSFFTNWVWQQCWSHLSLYFSVTESSNSFDAIFSLFLVKESGDSLEGIMDDEAVVLVNHQSTSDVPVVMAALHNKNLVLGKVMWIMDDIFKYTNFGWISYFHGDFFILQVPIHDIICFIVSTIKTPILHVTRKPL